MLDVLADVRRWHQNGQRCAVATVVSTFRSAPRPPGAAMAVGADGVAAGSVSGGCVEGAVYELAQEVIVTGRPVLQRYGVSDDDAFSVGLTCGGILDILVQPVNGDSFPELPTLAHAVDERRPVATATVITDGAHLGARLVVWPEQMSGSLGDPGLDAAVTADAAGMLSQAQTGVRHYGAHGERRLDDVAVFVQSYAPPPAMYVFGAIDFAGAVARIGRFLGYHVTVCDARAVFATERRFPDADDVVVAWPHTFLEAAVNRGDVDRRSVLCVLTHDPKFDVPLLEVALRTDAGYIGVMGSRRTHADRLDRLREFGVTQAQLSRLRAPVGLDIGARTPEETAVSIAAEIVAVRSGASGRPLSTTSGPIHGDHGLVPTR
ncbi:XdhC family protein [Phytoactinopolyspora limicola]|uniref:XdhC family protein n=1 Tax=Phytoactinopolyspora limicola TaxID=2715536 RepID=UPI0014096E8D|nr:XdhC family protein [Phytoactinopolyspora limicola]